MISIDRFCDRHGACKDGRDWAIAHCDSMLAAWQTLKPDWLVWVATRPGVLTDRELRLFAVFCAKQVEHLLTDQRSKDAIAVAERFAKGEATTAELDAAWNAARNAAMAAARAWRAARDASAADAAWSAAASWNAAGDASAADAAWSAAASWNAAVAAMAAASASASARAAASARDASWTVAWTAAWAAQADWLRENFRPDFKEVTE